jgi:tRNA pseudouridine55 synthase
VTAAKPEVHGLLVVDKPPGCTSHDVVARCRRIYGQRSVGHAGTLDPDATGVLLVGLGRATRLLRFVQDTDKAYEATIVFGVATDTLDASGEVTREQPMTDLGRDALVAATKAFVGEIEQVPPMVSAIKVGGRRLHELAREGVEIERAPRRVVVRSIGITRFTAGVHPEAFAEVVCGSGTYIRSLAADLGTALGGCAHVATLRRTRVGSFTADEAHGLDDLEARGVAALLTPAAMMRDLASVVVDDEIARRVANGATFGPGVLEGAPLQQPFAVLDGSGVLRAVYEPRSTGGVKPAVVLATDEAASEAR